MKATTPKSTGELTPAVFLTLAAAIETRRRASRAKRCKSLRQRGGFAQ